MKTFLLALVIVVGLSSASNGQLKQIYQTEYCCPSFGYFPIMGMKFFGIDSGIVFAQNDIAVTTDGGTSWQTHPWDSTPKTHSLAFLDIDHTWVTESGNIYRSSNGGTNWSHDSVLDEMGWNIKCLYFQDPLVGFAGADGLTIFRTSDGGKNWQRKHGPEVPDLADYYMEQIAFATPALGLAASGNFGTWILRTTDSGMTWTNLTDGTRSIGGFRPTGLSFPDPRNAFFSTSSRLYHSSDSGKTWKIVSVNPPNLLFQSLSFIDSLHGVATGAGSGLVANYTSDGGLNWQTFSIPAKVGLYRFTSFPDPSIAYISSYDAVYELKVNELSAPTQKTTILNPSLRFDDDRVLISIPEGSPASIRVIDMLGRIVDEHTTAPNAEAIFLLQQWPYQVFIEIHCGDKLNIFKVLH
jgi:photosystem II stability/assembly factor-like uncharacterized protein